MDKSEIQSWNFAVTFVTEVYTLTKQFPGGESETLSQRIRKTAISLSTIMNSLLNTENPSLSKHSSLYQLISLVFIMETYILIAGKYIFSNDVKILNQKLNTLKKLIITFDNSL